LNQLVRRSPAAFPSGTRPDAIPPTTVPSANGVSTEENVKRPPISRSSVRVALWLLSAYAVPRPMIPTAATNSGTTSVEAIDPNAVG
jgi:hypothetical protein